MNINSLITLWKQLALELAGWCGTSTIRDSERVSARCEHEGLSFLTITLPSFGKDFEQALEEQQVAPTSFAGFSKRNGLPKFLQGFLELVFELGSGRLLDEPNLDAVKSIRQLTQLFAKVDLPCTSERLADAFSSYIKCEHDVCMSDIRLNQAARLDFVRISSMLFRDVFIDLDRKIFNLELIPKHGPGVTADGLLGNQKYRQKVWPERLQDILPWEYYLAPTPRFVEELAEELDIVEPGSELPVKVIAVPKTLKTPRIIAIEPTCMQYAQQAIARSLIDSLTQDNNLSKMIGFFDQDVNHFMARLGSLNGSFATLDLSEASDRVSNLHVRLLTERFSLSKRAIQSARSLKADVPGYGVIPLAKYASMGSALTFPLEAMVFLTVVFHGIEKALNRPLDRSDFTTLRSEVRVFGDDIIVPVDYVHEVISSLQTFGFVVNERKSFWNGKFRESCGKEYYSGHDISIVKLRQVFPTSLRDAKQVISLVSFRNLCYQHGYWNTCKWLDSFIRKILPYFPDVLAESPALGRICSLGFESERMDPDLHRPLVKACVVSARSPVNSIDGQSALLKVFLQGDDFIVDENHLERSGRPKSVRIKTRWVPPY